MPRGRPRTKTIDASKSGTWNFLYTDESILVKTPSKSESTPDANRRMRGITDPVALYFKMPIMADDCDDRYRFQGMRCQFSYIVRQKNIFIDIIDAETDEVKFKFKRAKELGHTYVAIPKDLILTEDLLRQHFEVIQ